METQILEGTLRDVQRQLSELPLGSEVRLRVVVSSASESPISDIEDPSFRPTQFRNGVPLLPAREVAGLVDLDLVKRLLDDEDLELLRADRDAGRQRVAGDDGSPTRQS
jgi:hypothetical protein